MDEIDRPNYGSMRLKRGFWGVGIWFPKNRGNVGGILRNAHCFGADFVMTMGDRYKADRLDVTNATSHVPLFRFMDQKDFFGHVPQDCTTVAVELTDDADSLVSFCHPKRAVYVFGPEDGSLPPEVIGQCRHVIRLPTAGCLNVNVAAGIVMWDRMAKMKAKAFQLPVRKGVNSV